MVAIAVGVGGAEQLDRLGAAVHAARRFHEWATALGYSSRLITDDAPGTEVTIESLRQAFDAFLPSATNPPIHRLLVYFAGHGVIREADEGLWFLSDWYRSGRGVGVEALKRRLLTYDIAQVGLFADACRAQASPETLGLVDSQGVLFPGPCRSKREQTPVDKYFAAADYADAFAVPGGKPSDDMCIFSGVLLPALWGCEPDAFSPLAQQKVTSQSLTKYLRTQVPAKAQEYGLQLDPRAYPNFPELDDVYFDQQAGVPAPPLPAWPNPTNIIARRQGERLQRRSPSRPRTSPAMQRELGIDRGLRGIDRLAHSVTGGAALSFFVQQTTGDENFVSATTGAGYAVEYSDSGDYIRIETAETTAAGLPIPVLLVLGYNRVAALTAIPGLAAAVHVAPDGVDAIVYTPPVSVRGSTRSAIRVLAQLAQGGLRAEAASDLALQLRRGKHADPVLGAVAAYLYDAIDDIDSIRRTAFYYARSGEPIPFDVAMLAGLQGKFDRGEGVLRTSVPAVPRRAPRTRDEERTHWTTEGTYEVEGIVGGLWPWLRQGWALLDRPSDDGSTLVLPPLAEVASRLTPARFTTVDYQGANLLAEYFGMSDTQLL